MQVNTILRDTIQRNWRTAVAAVGIMLDLTIHAVSFLTAGAFYLQTTHVDTLLQTYAPVFALSVLIFFGAFTMFGIYRTLSYSSLKSQLYRAAKGYVYGVPIILCVVHIVGKRAFAPPAFFELFLILLPMFYLFAWAAIHGISDALRKSGYGGSNTIAVGSDPDFKRLLDRLRDHPELGYHLVSVLRTAGRDPVDGVDHVNVHAIRDLVDVHNIDQIVFSSSYQLNGSFNDLHDICRRNGISMRIVSPESDLLFTRAGLRDIAGIPVYTPEHRHLGAIKSAGKRLFDILGSLTALAILSPLFALVALAIKIESPGPVFFRQRRSLGAGDVPFPFIKFRSMRVGAEKEKEHLQDLNESNGALFKIKDDPRLTRVGRFIRKFSIDELPQLFNVLNGDMSLVGPRPLPIRDYEKISEEDHLGGYLHRRAQVKPGMTGLWQVSGRSELGFREMVLLDLYYIENQSILFDLEILAQSVPVVVFGRGAY